LEEVAEKTPVSSRNQKEKNKEHKKAAMKKGKRDRLQGRPHSDQSENPQKKKKALDSDAPWHPIRGGRPWFTASKKGDLFLHGM